MVEQGIITKEDIGIYQYGIQTGFLMLLNLFTALLIGLFTEKLLLVAVFTASFMTLRSYTGGYHSCSRIFCYISSSLVLFVPIYSAGWFQELQNQSHVIATGLLIILMLIASGIILWLSPMDSKNRILDAEEKRYFRKKAKVILGTQLFILAILYALDIFVSAFAIFSSICIIAVFMLIGKAVLQIQLHME